MPLEAEPGKPHPPFRHKEAKEKDARQESPYVGPERYATRKGVLVSKLGGAPGKLHQKPEAEEEKGGNLDHGENNEEWNEGHHAGLGIEEKVCPENARNGPGSPDIGDHRRGVDHDLGQKGNEAAEKVKRQVLPVPEGILHVVAEDVKVEHVAQDVQPPAMEKHGGQGREQFP